MILRALRSFSLDGVIVPMLPVVILAGGLATRLRPITETIPKSLVEVAGEPFVCRQLRQLKSHGVDTVVMCTGYLGEKIEEVIGSGEHFGLKVLYSSDGPKLLGTGGAIKQAIDRYPEELSGAFFVLYGDSYLPIDFQAVQIEYEKITGQINLVELDNLSKTANKANQVSKSSAKENFGLALMTVLKNQNQWDKSNALLLDSGFVEYNKQNPGTEMSHIDYGLSILTPALFNGYPSGEPFDLAEVLGSLSLSRQLVGYEVFERFYEIGSHQGLKECEEYFRLKDTQ